MRITFLVFLSLLLITSCDKPGTRDAVDSSTVEKVPTGTLSSPLNIQKGGSFASLDQIRVQALNLINHRNKEEPESLSMLTYAYWTPETVFDGKGFSKPGDYSGYWVKFEDDFTYSYGKNSKVFGKGKYHFRLDDKQLHMLDNDVELEPKVWRANHGAEVIALVGTHEFNVNNGMQIKMVAMTENPI